MVYNDSAFGGIKWSQDKTKIVFVAEKPEIESFKPFFKDEEEAKKGTDEDKKEEQKPEEHWQDEKYQY